MKINDFFEGFRIYGKPVQLMRIMKLTVLIMTLFLLQVSAASKAQITINEQRASLRTVMKAITRQSGYDFVYSVQDLSAARPVTIKLNNVSIDKALRLCFADQPLVYQISDKTVIVKPAAPSFLEKVVDAFTPPVDISGLVLDEKGLPLAGVTVRVKGTNKATFTDNAGKFYLASVDDDAVIEFRMIGYVTRELKANVKLETIQMQIASKELEEVVVAYGKTTQQALTGAVTVIKGEQIESLPNRSFDKSLQGLVPGLQITRGTGQPGGGLGTMVLRGISSGSDVSVGQTVRNPLIVIDGVPVSQDGFQYSPVGTNQVPITNPLAQLNPTDIETISVLKDAAAIALYGSRASNGVILVTTKTGKSGKTVFSFSHQTDFSSRPKSKIELLNQEEYLQLLYETYKNTPRVIGGVPTPWTDATILTDLKAKFPVRSDGSFYPMPDWGKELFNRNALTISNNLNMSGGNDKNSFYLNLEYTKENGVVPKIGYDRKSMRFNFESRPSSWLKLGTNTTLSYNNQLTGANGESDLAISPLNPVRFENGDYMLLYPFGLSSLGLNAVAKSEYNTNKNTTYRGLSKIYAEIKLLPNLIFKSDAGIDYMHAELRQKDDPRFHNGSIGVLPRIGERDERRANVINTNSLSYSKSIQNLHSINLLIAQESQILTQKQLGAIAIGTAATLPYYEQLNSPGYTMTAITGNASRQTLLSVFGQANYGFMNKYFLSGSIRRDGSSKFGDQAQWGTYWSAGAGWVISEENLLKRYTTWLNYFKIRGSIGASGNSGAVDPAIRFDQLSLNKFSGNTAVKHQRLGNPKIKWEETFTWDAGLEMRLLNERLSITVDIYNKKTNGLIYNTNLPSLAGFITVPDNIGDIKNKGVETSVSLKIIEKRDFNWVLNANWSTNKNVLVKAYVPLSALTDELLANEEGRNFNSYYMRIWAGVNPVDGKPQWLDAEGKPTSDPFESAKMEFVGKPQPDGFGTVSNSFNYKNFGLSFSFYYTYGAVNYNSSLNSLLNDGSSHYLNQVREALDYWKKPGDISANPRRLLNNSADFGNLVSTRYLSKGDYVRLSNVNLNYKFSKVLLNRIGLTSARVFLQGHNLALFTPYSGPDPDNAGVAGNTNFTYPVPRSFSVGLNVSF
jgi:TonB-linked SusC/RagA family outer membrane protein